MKRSILAVLLMAGLTGLTGCFDKDVAERPPAIDVPEDAISYFCSMNTISHAGPKAQIYLAGEDTPLWFSAVRDMFGFLMLPGESRDITAIWVSDMSDIPDWSKTQKGPWIDPRTAWFVVGSSRVGGMGAEEIVPFSDNVKARAFTDRNGGKVLKFAEISERHVFETQQEDDKG